MFKTERDTLRVDVPVGFLLAEPREIAVSVDRPSDTPLSIRLRLIPAQVDGLPGLRPAPVPVIVDEQPARRWPPESCVAFARPSFDKLP